MNFSDLESRLVQLEDALLAGAEKVAHPPFKLAYRVGDMLIVRDTEPGDLPQHDIVFNGWRVYSLGKRVMYHIKSHDGRFLGGWNSTLVADFEDACVFDTHEAAIEVCTQELAECLGVVLAVCSSEEL